MFYSDVVDSYLGWCKNERRMAVSTLKTYKEWLAHYRRFCERLSATPLAFEAALSPVLVKRYFYHCTSAGWQPRTIRSTIIALRGLSRWAIAQQYLTADPTLGIVLPKLQGAARPVASDDDLTKLMNVVEMERDNRRRARERAMLYVLAMTGVRFSELLDLGVADVDLVQKTLRIVNGKGGKMRLLYPPAECISALNEWLIERRKMNPKHVWLWAYDIKRKMGEAGTRQMLEDLKARAGLSDVDAIKPHALRRAFATRMLRAGCDLKSIQAALGHSQAQTTFLYLGMHDLPAKAMAESASLPAPAFAPNLPDAVQPRRKDKPASVDQVAVPHEQNPPTAPARPRRAAQYYQRRRTPAR